MTAKRGGGGDRLKIFLEARQKKTLKAVGFYQRQADGVRLGNPTEGRFHSAEDRSERDGSQKKTPETKGKRGGRGRGLPDGGV